jgi:hypothetical protein
MQLSTLATKPNLDLAWRRITTGTNQQYKRFYRELYYAYELSLSANLGDLRARLLAGTYRASAPERIYLPKASGLHRPLSLLTLEDQVVLQAFANLAAKKLQSRRAPLQFSTVFSNIVSPDSIFFFRRWQDTYRSFQSQVRQKYRSGLVWVGDFDLAAFYETISHQLLLKTIYPRSTGEGLDFIRLCLQRWSAVSGPTGYGHGIPQGPLASDFLAECFLLPVDLALRDVRGYIRYVDDVRLFGASEDEVRSDLISLERRCRERGLIPQVGKFAIKRVYSVTAALGMLPSVADPQHEDLADELDGKSARLALKPAVGGRPTRVIDRTRLRYVLYRAQPDREVLKTVLRLAPRHPEHADAFFAYLGRFQFRVPIERLCVYLLERSPYGYVRGEAWHRLATYLVQNRGHRTTTVQQLADRAVMVSRQGAETNFAEKFGACHYLCCAEEVTKTPYTRFLWFQEPLIQAFVGSALPATALGPGQASERMLRRSLPEPGLAVVSLLAQHGGGLAGPGVDPSSLPGPVANALVELGLAQGASPPHDSIGHIMTQRFLLDMRGKSWRVLLGDRYVQAQALLRYSEAAFESGRSSWLQNLNSFNHLVFVALQAHLHAIQHPAACTTIGSDGSPVSYGSMLHPLGPFSRTAPRLGRWLREINQRRNRLPASHPFDLRTGAPSQPLALREQRNLVAQLQYAYADLVLLMP